MTERKYQVGYTLRQALLHVTYIGTMLNYIFIQCVFYILHGNAEIIKPLSIVNYTMTRLLFNRSPYYRQVSNISCTLVGNKIVDYSDVVGASPVGAAPTTASSRLNTWLHWIGQRQLQNETINIYVWDLVRLILEILRYILQLDTQHTQRELVRWDIHPSRNTMTLTENPIQ